jgi:hypothetical protein
MSIVGHTGFQEADRMPMIHAETVKAAQQLLQERGVEHREDEPWGDYFARGLGVSQGKAEAFLEALHNGCSVEEAKRAAGIVDGTGAIRIARTIGIALGKIRRQIAPAGKCGPVPNQRARTSSIGATEDQVNMTLQSPQRIDGHGTRAEDVAGTGVHDSLGG